MGGVRDFPGSPVVRTQRVLPLPGHELELWWDNYYPACHVVWPKKKKKKSGGSQASMGCWMGLGTQQVCVSQVWRIQTDVRVSDN